MPSDLVIEVCRVENISEHTNSDNLELIQVKGWQIVTRKNEFQQGMKIVYFPPDTLLPQEWTDQFNVTQYCQEKANMRRIHRVRLRGEYSFGLVVPIPYPDWEEGREVAGYYQAKKYEPPILCKHVNAAPEDPMVPKYTDIQNMRNFPRIFETGEEVILTEKCHGSNCRVGIVDGVRKAGSHKHLRKEMAPEDMVVNWYWYPWTVPAISEMIEALGKDHKQVIVYGETFGPVQFLKYNSAGKLDFCVFDIMLDFEFVNYDRMMEFCNQYGVKTVPLVARISYSLEAVKGHSEGNTLINGANHMREGVVVRPIVERKDPKIGRVVLKYVSDSYLFNKKATSTDNTDE
jgi:RNA ligase (TIGR02306 family)